jgi:excisionase family DNA binding protein
MATGKRGVAGRTSGNNLEPLAVSPRQACLLLGIGNTRLYQLIGNGELIAYREGRARRVTMASICARVAGLAAAGGTSGFHTAQTLARFGARCVETARADRWGRSASRSTS